MRKGRISKKPTRAMLDRALPREVMPLGDGVWRVAGHHRDRVQDGYVVVDDGDCIRCECRAAQKGRWCLHRVAVWALVHAWDEVKPVKWYSDHRIFDVKREIVESLFSSWKKRSALAVYADKSYLSEGESRG